MLNLYPSWIFEEMKSSYTMKKHTSIPGIIMSGLLILFMLFDAVMKLVQPDPVIESTVSLGFREHHILPIGIIGLLCTILYSIPKTSLIGAILMTGYFGGAIVTNFRMDQPLFTHILFPIYLSLLLWGGLILRNPQLKQTLLNQNAR